MKERKALIEDKNDQIGVARQCVLLEIPKSSYYYQSQGVSTEDIRLMGLIDEIYTKHVFYGTRRIKIELRDKYAELVNRKRISRLMRIMGIVAVIPKRNLSKARSADLKFPYLLKNLAVVRVNQVWGTDITYIRLKNGWVYLTAIIDWYSRYIVDWEISISLEAGFCCEMMGRALRKAIAEIVNVDQGSHYTSPVFTNIVTSTGSLLSMDSKGRALDNIFTERFWRSLKYEDIYLKDYETVAEVKTGVAEYIKFYNEDRPHQSLGYNYPADVYYQSNLNLVERKEQTLS